MNGFLACLIPVALAWFGGFCIGFSDAQDRCKSGTVVVKTDSAVYRCVPNKLVEMNDEQL